MDEDGRTLYFFFGRVSKPRGSHFGVGAPPILGFIFVGIGMFTGGITGPFDPWLFAESVVESLMERRRGIRNFLEGTARRHGHQTAQHG